MVVLVASVDSGPSVEDTKRNSCISLDIFSESLIVKSLIVTNSVLIDFYADTLVANTHDVENNVMMCKEVDLWVPVTEDTSWRCFRVRFEFSHYDNITVNCTQKSLHSAMNI